VNYSDAIILGIVQGLTEFLPVSSSGHLALTQDLIGLDAGKPPIVFDLLLHVATLFAVLIYFRRRIISLVCSLFDRNRKEEHRLILLLTAATIPIVITGYASESILSMYANTLPLYLCCSVSLA